MNTKLILGTVQFGLDYGINNSKGKPSEKDVFDILEIASKQKIESLDTADSYGDAIDQIGRYHQQRKYRFKILSKFKGVSQGELFDQAENSLNKLHIPHFEVYSYHSFADYLDHPFLKDELLSLKNKGLIRKTGISVYTNSELRQVIMDKGIDVIQLPYNLLDNQNIRGQSIDQAKRNNKEIHVRTVFLQGLLFIDVRSIPEKLMPLKPYIQKIRSYCENNSINLQSLALSYAVYNKLIDHVLIGVDTADQLLKNIESVADLKSSFEYIDRHINVEEIELLNPVNWK